MPLIQEAKGYEFKGRPPTGRCVVEERNNTGKISVWVQDLMPETKYEIYLIFTQGQQYMGLHMGALDVDAKGKAAFRREVKHLHSFTLTEFAAAVIIAADAHGVVSPLCGYRDTQISWRNRFSIWKTGAPTAAPDSVMQKAQVIESDPFPTVKETLETVEIEPPSTIEKAQQIILDEPFSSIKDKQPQQNEAKPLTVEAEPPSPIPIAAIPSPPRAKKPTAASPPLQTNPEASGSHHSRTSTIQLIEAIFNANTPCEPFTKQDSEIKWVQCSRPEQIPLPNDSPHLMSEPFMQAAWADHEHFILGVTLDSEPPQYIIGIPGTYTRGNNTIAKRLGFLKFKCLKKDRPGIGSEGYWLMFVEL